MPSTIALIKVNINRYQLGKWSVFEMPKFLINYLPLMFLGTFNLSA